MLHFFWTLEFEAVQKGEMLPVFQILSLEAVEKGEMLPDFQILSFEAVDKGGMLSVFQILFSGRPQGGGNMLSVFFSSHISCSWRLEKGFSEPLENPWEPWEGSGEGSGRRGGGLLVGREEKTRS